MNNTRQAEWVSHQGPNCSSLDWYGIQTLFAGAKSEVLILLDTCAAASSAATSQFGVMETIAACGFESRAAPPGEFSFTHALIEIMRDWINKPSFSVSILHTEILFQLKQKENKRGREGTKLEWCSSPIYLRYTQDTRSPGIELYRRTSPVTPEAVPVMVPRPTTYTHATEVNLDNPSRKMSPFYSLSQDKRYRVPRVLISISLEEDQPQLDSENCTRWFASMPFLAADVEVFPSCSTLVIMSIPLPVWNMFPDHPACSFIGYVTAPKLKNTGFPREICDSEVSQIKQDAAAASFHGDDDAEVTVSQWKPGTSFQPDLTRLKLESHVTTGAHNLAESERSIPAKNSYLQTWIYPARRPGTSILLPKPTLTDMEVPTQKEPEEMRHGEQKNIGAKEWVRGRIPRLQTTFTTTSGPSAALGIAKSDITDQQENSDEKMDSDDDSEEMDRLDQKQEDPIVGNYEGFKAHVHRLNPDMDPRFYWLVDRVAHQQEVRYKNLLDIRVRHSQAILGRSCSAGQHCLALGGSVVLLDAKGGPRDSERSSPGLQLVTDFSGDENPGEGALTDEAFPKGIPMPPARSLPAVFECQLCFKAKKFQKPSDWTKHVHEDLQPFTCTYAKCKESKLFKRKADWLRHENERHRHLEWWICQVDDCMHPCYRKDNFLQHLVREHKLPEPKQKMKAATKQTRLTEPAWIMIEQCHHETSNRPQDELCKFCGKSFPTWKMLMKHLAKHMEQIALPILKLVEMRNIDADTIISPVDQILTPVSDRAISI
jgi:hypothetical protein